MSSYRRAAPRAAALAAILFTGGAVMPIRAGEAPSAPAAPELRLGQPEPGARAQGAIRLATYNIENLFDNRDDPALNGDEDDLKSIKPDGEKAAVASTMKRLDADILGLEEVESHDALNEFRAQYLKGQGYDYMMSIEVGGERGIENSVLSRFPITEARVWPHLELGGVHPAMFGDRPNRYAGQPLLFRRSPLCVTVEVPADRSGSGKPYLLTLFVVHHKSGRGNEYWREAESRKVVELIRDHEKLHPGANIALLGDFNATPEDKSVQTYRDAGLVDVFADRASMGSRGLTHASGRTIDFIFVNQALASELVAGSRFALGTPQRPADADWRTTPTPPGYASDHIPVSVDLQPIDK